MFKNIEFYAWLCDFKFPDLDNVLISRKNYRLLKNKLTQKYWRELCLCVGQFDILLLNLKLRFYYSKLDINTYVLLFNVVLIWQFSWFCIFPKCLNLKFIVSRYDLYSELFFTENTKNILEEGTGQYRKWSIISDLAGY